MNRFIVSLVQTISNNSDYSSLHASWKGSVLLSQCSVTERKQKETKKKNEHIKNYVNNTSTFRHKLTALNVFPNLLHPIEKGHRLSKSQGKTVFVSCLQIVPENIILQKPPTKWLNLPILGTRICHFSHFNRILILMLMIVQRY